VHRQRRNGRHDEREACGEIVAVAGDQAHPLGARARMRKPSCLISCSQLGPLGGALAGDGKQGSIRLLRCNMVANTTF
jgi:hypothetical protein